ncbi:protease [Pycnococcus provasolii]|uniref:Protease n=1 Tax=Pycnococcus provasolii TaxID=41880 RepID=A0A830I494_9CHLO|nr:protease [Pycnococcus provasolii]
MMIAATTNKMRFFFAQVLFLVAIASMHANMVYHSAEAFIIIEEEPIDAPPPIVITNPQQYEEVFAINANENYGDENEPGLANDDDVNMEILGGTPALLNAFPFAVSIAYKNCCAPGDLDASQFYSSLDEPTCIKNCGVNQHICGGTIISQDYILTAAHCVCRAFTGNRTTTANTVAGFSLITPNPFNFFVRAGAYNLWTANTPNTAGVETIQVSEIVCNPRFSAVEWQGFDIALLRLATPTTFPRVDLNFDPLLPLLGSTTIAVGWGDTAFRQGVDEDNDPDSNIPLGTASMQQVAMPFVPNKVCFSNATQLTGVIEDTLESKILNTDTQICAGFVRTGGRDACFGDSGGPLLLRTPYTKTGWTQVGITSWGVGCGVQKLPGVYARISALKGFIVSTVGPKRVTATGIRNRNACDDDEKVCSEIKKVQKSISRVATTQVASALAILASLSKLSSLTAWQATLFAASASGRALAAIMRKLDGGEQRDGAKDDEDQGFIQAFEAVLNQTNVVMGGNTLLENVQASHEIFDALHEHARGVAGQIDEHATSLLTRLDALEQRMASLASNRRNADATLDRLARAMEFFDAAETKIRNSGP